MDKQPILSLCIPTNGAVNWILPVIESIYAQNYDNEKFEVVITDNGKDSQLPVYISQMNYKNLRYKQTNDEGFLNLVSCLKEGNGLFCKMINHRSVLLQGSIADMVDVIMKYRDTQPIIYCVDGMLKDRGELIECKDINELVKNLYYWCSWSAGIGFWQKDIEFIDKVKLNFMFPNASLLFYIRKEPHYIIWNKRYDKMSDDTGKGGYNVFETFGITFIDILNELRQQGRLNLDTFLFAKKKMYEYVCQLYYQEVMMPTRHTFMVDNAKQYMGVYFSKFDYWRMIIKYGIKAPLAMIKHKIIK